MKPTILITGGKGLVGTRLCDLFGSDYHWQHLDLNGEPKVDITSFKSIDAVVPTDRPISFIVHLAAYTDVNGAWQQNGDQAGLAYQINVQGTQNIIRLCGERKLHLIHVSTAFVFNGQKTTGYIESDSMGAIDWYGKTKQLAEEAVVKSGVSYTILRIDNPFRIDQLGRLDVIGRILRGLETQTLPPQFTDSFVGPTCIDDFSRVINWVLRTKATGIFHATTNESWTPFQLAQAVADHLPTHPLIQASSVEAYLKQSARPYLRNSALDSSKLRGLLDFTPLTVRQALDQIDWTAARAHATGQ